MNTTFVAPAAEKTADSAQAAGRRAAVKRNDPVAVDNELFAELLLLLSPSPNNMTMLQTSRDNSLSSGLNHGNDFQKGQTMPIEADTVAGHLQDSVKWKEERPPVIDQAWGDSNASGIGVNMPDMDNMDGFEGYQDMKKFMDKFNEQVEENTQDVTPDITPEMIPNMLQEVTSGNISEAAQARSDTGRAGIITQLSWKLIDMYHTGGNSAKIMLHPEELGHIKIDISVVDDSIRAIVTVEENSIRDVLESNIDILVQELKDAGLNMDQFTVKTMSSYNDGNMAGWRQDGGSREMFSNRAFSHVMEHDDIAMHDSVHSLTNAGSGSISIFV